jgi:spermidine synthase
MLLFCFFVAAIIGLFLAIQVNYKIKSRLTDQLMVWHVDFGIGLAMVAIFHFLWHVKYYTDILKFRKKSEEAKDLSSNNREKTEKGGRLNTVQKLPIFALGATSIITQIVILREFLSIFEGNELVVGTILGNWMILTALGSFLARSVVIKGFSKSFIFYALTASGIIPIILIILLNILKNLVFPLGSMIGLFQIFVISFILLFPFCILTGFLFTYYAFSFSESLKYNMISKVYVLEATGSLIAGLIYSFILIYFLHSLQIISIILLVNLVIAIIYTGNRPGRIIKFILSAGIILLVCSVFIFRLDERIKSQLYPNQKILFMKDTPQGKLVVTESAGQNNFFEDNSLLFSTDNFIANEESAHFAMLQHPSPESVLLIGGGISGIIEEILKYPVKRIDYIEVNPWIVRTGKRFTKSLDDSRIRVFTYDPRLFIRKAQSKYDVIINQIPSPSSAKINRFFTLEFFNELKTITNERGILSLSLPATENYVSEKESQVQSVIFHTLREVFDNVVIIPGEKNYFIASDGIPDTGIASLSQRRGLDNIYVNPYYLDDENLRSRSRYIHENIIHVKKLNKDFQPVAYFIQTGYWMSKFGSGYLLPGILCLVLYILLIFWLNRINLGLFTTGFTSSAMEMLIIFSFQIIFGYVYQVIGIIIAIYMAGLATGAYCQRRILKNETYRNYRNIQFIIAAISLIIPSIFILLNSFIFRDILMYLIFFSITAVISVIAGIQFSLASRLQKKSIAEVAAGIYSIDLLGSAIGILLVSVYLLPLLGLVRVFILLAGLNLISGLISFSMGKRV